MLRHFVELKIVDRAENTEEILDGLAGEAFSLPRLNQTSHERIGNLLERSVLQMWKDVFVQLARHAALRRALLVDGEVKIFPATGRQTKRKDWRLGEGKMTCVVDTGGTPFSCAGIWFPHLKPGNQRTANAGERKERSQGAVRKATGVTRVREWRGGVPAPICSVRVGFRGGEEFNDERRCEDLATPAITSARTRAGVSRHFHWRRARVARRDTWCAHRHERPGLFQHPR